MGGVRYVALFESNTTEIVIVVVIRGVGKTVVIYGLHNRVWAIIVYKRGKPTHFIVIETRFTTCIYISMSAWLTRVWIHYCIILIDASKRLNTGSE